MVEVTVVMAILVTLFVVSGVAYSKLQKSAASAVSDREIGNVLGAAARRARSGVNGTDWGVYVPYDETTRITTSMVIFSGASYASRDASHDIVFPVNNDIQFTSVDWSGAQPDVTNSHEIVFTSLTGATTQYGSVTVSWYGETSTISIPSNGIPVR